MAGFGHGLAYNIFPAEFGQISHNITNNMHMAAQGFAKSQFQTQMSERGRSIDDELLKIEADRDADGHAHGAPQRRAHRKPAPPPPAHRLQKLAGDGAIFDTRG